MVHFARLFRTPEEEGHMYGCMQVRAGGYHWCEVTRVYNLLFDFGFLFIWAL